MYWFTIASVPERQKVSTGYLNDHPLPENPNLFPP